MATLYKPTHACTCHVCLYYYMAIYSEFVDIVHLALAPAIAIYSHIIVYSYIVYLKPSIFIGEFSE